MKTEPTGARVWNPKEGHPWIEIRLTPCSDIVSLAPGDAERIMNAIQRCLWEIETKETNRILGLECGR